MLDRVHTALVTGSTSGIGEAFARELASRGVDVVLVARRTARLHALAQELSACHGVRMHVVVVDLARPGAADELFAETEHLGIDVDLLVNNAGCARWGAFSDLPFEPQAGMVRLNVNAVVELARLYLPGMRQRRLGGIINIASIAAFQPAPYLAVYAASKAFVLHFSEALAEEVARDGVRVLALCPGPVDTEFWQNAGISIGWRRLMASPQVVARAGLRALESGRSFYVPGLGYRVVAFAASRLGPRQLVARIAGWILGRNV